MLGDLTAAQRDAVRHEGGPLLIIAGAGTGKTTVITRRIAWLIATQRARPDEILALTFTEKAATEMEERVDLLVPYGYVDVTIKTFHAFGDQLLREHALRVGLSPHFRVLTQAEQIVFLRQHLFTLPLEQFRPLNDPGRFLGALATLFARVKDEAVSSEEFSAYADEVARHATDPNDLEASQATPRRLRELAEAYAAYQQLLRQADAVDFGDQVWLVLGLLERHPDVAAAVQRRFRYILIDEFQDTNYAQFRLVQLLAPPLANVTVVADDDQSIYKWRGAAISNVVKFLEHYASARTVVLTDNFRSGQRLLDCAYRLIRFNDPDRLEVRRGIDKKLTARAAVMDEEPHVHVFDTVSSEADWVAGTIREAVESGARRPGEIAILVRSNREADLFLRALNVAGIPWRFSGASGLLARPESKLLLSCLKALADPDDSLSWYHVASSPLYRCPMEDLAAVLAFANRTHQSFRAAAQSLGQERETGPAVSEAGLRQLGQLLRDAGALLELSRTHSSGQVLYRWLSMRGWLSELAGLAQLEESLQLQTIARFFTHLQQIESLGGGRLPELMTHLDLFQAMGNEPVEDDDAWADQVNVLTIHKAKGLEFQVVFMVGLVQGRFPTPKRPDPIELPDALIKDLLSSGDYHLQEERRLFYVGMTRAKEVLYLSCAYDYGGKTVRKISQFVREALDLPSPSPRATLVSAAQLIHRAKPQPPLAVTPAPRPRRPLRVDPHGIDDYLTCPLKYRYSHILKIPAMRHHLVVYGTALHKAVEAFFKRRLEGVPMNEQELLEAFERHWNAEGFLTREHEALRRAQGREVLQRFYSRQQETPEQPTAVEEKFKFLLDDVLVVGRWDRVDRRGDEVVIIDYKSSDVRDQATADRRAKESLQLFIYALAWHTLHGQLPARVELRFLDTEVVGSAAVSPDDLEQTKCRIQTAAQGIRAQAFEAKPQEHACRWCAFQAICPFAFHARSSPA